MATTYVRSYNPIWNLRDLTGLPLDDNSWVYFLENEIPYAPEPVYQTASGTAWSIPVQVSAAGTLTNIFMDPNKVYRIEIRTNNGVDPVSQADALVWLIENYVPNGNGGDTPITTASINSDNQITNPQFANIDFVSGYSASGLSGGDYPIAPGWVLHTEGTGTITLEQTAIAGTEDVRTNPPYALRLQLSGWDSSYLKQTFSNASGLWASKYVNFFLLGKSEGSNQDIAVTLNTQAGTKIIDLASGTLTTNFAAVTNAPKLDPSLNGTTPPTAEVQLRINFPDSTDFDISLTSIQIVATDNEQELPYEQETVERSIDQTFHVYKDSLLFMPKASILTGWDFPKNPWQFRSTTLSNLAGTGTYVADQTVVITEEADSVQVGRATDPLGALQIQSRAATQGLLAVVQIIDPASAISAFGNTLSAMARLKFDTGGSTSLKFKMDVIYRDDLPGSGGSDPIASWTATGPVYKAGWTAVNALNDPEYTATNLLADYEFNKFVIPANTNAAATLGIVLYTTVDLDSGTTDNLYIEEVSLVQNEFAVKANPLTYDETLRQCQYYYEKSYLKGVVPATNTASGIKVLSVPLNVSGGNQRATLPSFTFDLQQEKRANPSMTFYLEDGSAGELNLAIYSGPTLQIQADYPISNYTVSPTPSQVFMSNDVASNVEDGADATNTGRLTYHYVADARIGL